MWSYLDVRRKHFCNCRNLCFHQSIFALREASKDYTELILKSRRVVPKKLLDAGFDFKFETWQKAARNLCD